MKGEIGFVEMVAVIVLKCLLVQRLKLKLGED